MDKDDNQVIPRVSSYLATNKLSNNVKSLLIQTSLDLTSEDIIDLANLIEEDIEGGYNRLLSIEKKIGGVGLHNVNVKVGERYTGRYKVELRPLFRSFQYVQSYISMDDLVWNARRIVVDSCLHIENSVKFRIPSLKHEKASLGVLLNWSVTKNELEPSLMNLLLDLNRIV
jgi:hypothetical protein